MKSLFLFPYGLIPASTGAKVEAWKTLNVLKSIGECTVFSAATKPVGSGWAYIEREQFNRFGYKLILREEVQKRKNLLQVFGIIFAGICKIAGFENFFGHSNPYHRYAFPKNTWHSLTKQYDIAIINYSYWASLPSECPKIIILHDLLSNTMGAYSKGETKDLLTAELVVVISCEEEQILHKRGIYKTLWSPPAVERIDEELSDRIGVVGSANRFNIEGMRWLSTFESTTSSPIHVFGDVGKYVKREVFNLRGRYQDGKEPYRECGIILIPTGHGTGVQIKTVEALAAGRAIIARRGGMRGIPHSSDAWIEVDTPNEMIKVASRLAANIAEREQLGRAAHAYYEKHLNATHIRNRLRSEILKRSKNKESKVEELS